MKRILLSLLLFACLAATAIGTLPAIAAPTATLTVCANPACDHSTIQSAIIAASNGDIISVLDPTHVESQINVFKSVTIRGLGSGSTNIEAPGFSGLPQNQLFSVPQNVSVNIEQLALRNSARALSNLGSVTMSEVVIRNMDANIFNQAGAALTIDNSDIRSHSNASTAIFSLGALTMTNSTVQENRLQITDAGLITIRDGSVFMDNMQFLNNAFSGVPNEVTPVLYFDNAASGTVRNSLFLNNDSAVTILGRNAFDLVFDNVTFDNSDLRERAFFYLGDDSVQIVNSRFENNSTFGALYVTDDGLTIDGTTFANNLLADNDKNGGAIDHEDGALHIVNSRFEGNSAENGGAISLESRGTLTVTNTTFQGNRADLGGGGVYQGISATGAINVLNSKFYSNTAFFGGAVSLLSNDKAIIRADFTRCFPATLPANSYCSEMRANRAAFGGALYSRANNFEVEETLFDANIADSSLLLDAVGAAIYIFEAQTFVANSLFTNHSRAPIWIESGSFGSSHNLFTENTGLFSISGAGTVSDAAEVNLFATILWDEGTEVIGGAPNFQITFAACNNTRFGALVGTGNISAEPQFTTTPRGDYRPSASSPGNDDCGNFFGEPRDMDGLLRDSQRDMGPFEFGVVPTAVQLSQSEVAPTLSQMIPWLLLMLLLALTLITAQQRNTCNRLRPSRVLRVRRMYTPARSR